MDTITGLKVEPGSYTLLTALLKTLFLLSKSILLLGSKEGALANPNSSPVEGFIQIAAPHRA